MTLKRPLISLKDFELTPEEKIENKELLHRWIALGVIDVLFMVVMTYFFIQNNSFYAYSTFAISYLVTIIAIVWIISSNHYKNSILIARKKELKEKASFEYVEMLNQLSRESDEDLRSSLLQDIFRKWPSFSGHTSRFWNHRDLLIITKGDLLTHFFRKK